MCHMIPSVMDKPVFPTRDEPIDQRNLFLLSGKAVSRCKLNSLQEKQVQSDQKSNFQILVICENKPSKVKLDKSNFVKKITECNYLLHFKTLHIFLSIFL